MANKISVLIDVAVDGANRQLKSFRSAVTDADTATGKFKAGAGAAMDSIKANAGNLAMAGGAALIGFGVKAVAAFQDLSLEAGRMSEALGMSVEETSRFIEVAGDLGVESSALETIIGKMNQTAGKTPSAFAAINAEIVKNADGTTNVNETFLATVDALNRIEDPAKRAAAAQQIFGRSWRDSAELIGQSSDSLRKSLAAVNDAKVIDDREVAKARKLREAMDELKDKVEEAALSIGGSLAPMLSRAAGNAADMVEVLNDLGLLDLAAKVQEATSATGAFARVVDVAQGDTDLFGRKVRNLTEEQTAFRKAADEAGFSTVEQYAAMEAGITTVEGLRDMLASAGEVTEHTSDATLDLARATELASAEQKRNAGIMSDAEINAGRIAATVDELTEAFADLKDEISDDNAYLDAVDGFQDVRDAAFTAYTDAAAGSANAAQSARGYQREINNQKLEVIAFTEEIGNVPEETTAEILAALDRGEVDRAEELLANLARTRRVNLDITSTYTPTRTTLPGGRTVVMHDGGIVGGQSFAGLRNDEVPAVLQKGEAVLTEGQQKALGSGGSGTTVVNVYPQIGTDELKLAKYIKQVLAKGERNGGI